MPICFKTLNSKNPDEYYNSANIVFLTAEGNRNKLIINNDDLSVELIYKTLNILKCDPKTTDITVNYNSESQDAVIEYRSPELYYMRNVSRIISIKMEGQVSTIPTLTPSFLKPLNFTNNHFDVTDTIGSTPNVNVSINGEKTISNIDPINIINNIFQLISDMTTGKKSPQQASQELQLIEEQKAKVLANYKNKV